VPLPTYNPDEILEALQRADYKFVLEKAMSHAVAGNADAQCVIALLFEAGLGVKRNVVEAEYWLRKSAKRNSALGWHNLGTLYAAKHPELKSRWDQAQECWKKAAELGFDRGYPYPPR